MVEYTFDDFVRELEMLDALPMDDRWGIVMNPELSDEDKTRLLTIIYYLGQVNKEED